MSVRIYSPVVSAATIPRGFLLWYNISGFQGVAFLYLPEQGYVVLNALVSVYRRLCNPTPFSAIWCRPSTWWSPALFSVGVWVILTNMLFCWSGEWNTINLTGTLIPFLAHMWGGEATDSPCHKVTPLLCQVSVTCTCFESSWLPQFPLLTGRVALASGFLSGAVIPCYLLADSNQAFEGLRGSEQQWAQWESLTIRFFWRLQRNKGPAVDICVVVLGRWVLVCGFPLPLHSQELFQCS